MNATKTIASALTLLLLACATPGSKPTEREPAQSAFGPVLRGPTTDRSEHFNASMRRFEIRLGVDARTFMKLWSHYRIVDPKGENPESVRCLDGFADSDAGRNAFLECLREYESPGLNSALFARMFDLRTERVQKVGSSIEEQKTIALFAFFEDLIRERLHNIGQNTQWYVRGKGFLPEPLAAHEYPYEDGDVILVIGNSSISSLISQATSPQRKYSHGVLVRNRNGKITKVEALLEKGVVKTEMPEFKKSHLNTVTVLRWRNEVERPSYARDASDCAWDLAERKTQYNFSMDVNDTSKMFCSQLVAHCYSRSSGAGFFTFSPEISTIRSRPVFEFLQNLGVNSERMISPGDLIVSPYLEVVAEFRRVSEPAGRRKVVPHLARAWDLMLMGDVFVERLELGYKLQFNWMDRNVTRGLIDGFDRAGDSISNAFGGHGTLLPNGITAKSLGFMAYMQKKVYDRAFEALEKEQKRLLLDPGRLLDMDPISRRAYLSYIIDADRSIRSDFNPN